MSQNLHIFSVPLPYSVTSNMLERNTLEIKVLPNGTLQDEIDEHNSEDFNCVSVITDETSREMRQLTCNNIFVLFYFCFVSLPSLQSQVEIFVVECNSKLNNFM